MVGCIDGTFEIVYNYLVAVYLVGNTVEHYHGRSVIDDGFEMVKLLQLLRFFRYRKNKSVNGSVAEHFQDIDFFFEVFVRDARDYLISFLIGYFFDTCEHFGKKRIQYVWDDNANRFGFSVF